MIRLITSNEEEEIDVSMSCGPGWTIAHIGLKFPLLTVGAVGAFIVLSEDNTPMIAITFDDGYKSVYTEAFPEMRSREMIGTSYITLDFISQDNRMDASEISSLYHSDWEIGAHGITHDHMTQMENSHLITELVQPIRVLNAVSGGQDILSVASPYGDWNENLIDLVKESYSSHVNAWSDKHGLNEVHDFDPYNVHRQDIAWTDVETVCDRISNLPDDSLYVLIFHDISDIEDKYKTTLKDFKDILDCIEESKVNVVRVSDGVEAMNIKAK